MKLLMLAMCVGAAASLEAKYVGEKPQAPELEGVITVSRTINTLTKADGSLTVDKDCTSTDAHGSNDCTIHFGDTLKLTYDLKLEEDLAEGSTIAIDAKLDNIIPFKAECAACGANCSITVPVIKKTFDIQMPDCPISATELKNVTTVTLPAKSPVPIALSAKGSITVTDAAKNVVVDADFEAALK